MQSRSETKTSDLMPVVWAAFIRSYIARQLEHELAAKPDNEIKLKGSQINDWSKRLLDALDTEWQKIRSE